MLSIRTRAPRHAFERFRLGASAAVGTTPGTPTPAELEHAPRSRNAFARFGGVLSRLPGEPAPPLVLELEHAPRSRNAFARFGGVLSRSAAAAALPSAPVVTNDGTPVVTGSGVFVAYGPPAPTPPAALVLEPPPRSRNAFARFGGLVLRSALVVDVDDVITDDGIECITESGATVTWGADDVITESGDDVTTDDDSGVTA